MLKFSANLTCPNDWKGAHNDSETSIQRQRFCWRVFDKVQMTWQAAHTFCLQHDSRLANSTHVDVIKKSLSFLNDGRRYWMDGAHIKVYPPQDPLQDWYWLDGRQFTASNRRGLYGELSYTGKEKRCAMIRDSKNAIGIWKDSCCDVNRSFICKKKEFINITVLIVFMFLIRRGKKANCRCSQQLVNEVEHDMKTKPEVCVFNLSRRLRLITQTEGMFFL